MPEIRRRQDFGLWLKLLKRVEHAHPIADSLATYRVRPSSMSFNKRVAAQYTWRLYRQVESLPLHVAAYYFMHYALRGLWSHFGLPLRKGGVKRRSAKRAS
jgi:teichuronic acid biosynthesis glycosyltransferase TuaG